MKEDTMPGILDGVRVVELAAWTFVPAAGAVLADWGADVIKVEHPQGGDPQRGLISSGLVPGGGGVNYLIEQPNRGKRSIGIDVANPDGRELLYRLIEGADVFLTNLLPDSCRRLGVDVEAVRARNPKIIYARGHGQGVRGEAANTGGFDGAIYWGQAGVANAYIIRAGEYPPLQRPAFGDIMGGQTIAGGIAAALFRRERSGEPSVVDVSLLHLGLWNLAPDIVAAGLTGAEVPRFDRAEMPNPVANLYKTSDGRFLLLMYLQSDRHWPDFCEAADRPDLLDDPRFKDARARFENRRECIAVLDEIFASQPLSHWRERLSKYEGVWGPVQTELEVHDDPQVIANGYIPEVVDGNGNRFGLVSNPVQFDEQSADLSPAPDHGQHTEEVLLELGLDWDRIIALKESSAIL
jgi:crotonobetainyl-CoA:carnitine CoA-transferase CaiB-like acyl-CoA transferase